MKQLRIFFTLVIASFATLTFANKEYDVNWILSGSSFKSELVERDTEIEKMKLIIKELRAIINYNMKR